jgi:hypothetical protein
MHESRHGCDTASKRCRAEVRARGVLAQRRKTSRNAGVPRRHGARVRPECAGTRIRRRPPHVHQADGRGLRARRPRGMPPLARVEDRRASRKPTRARPADARQVPRSTTRPRSKLRGIAWPVLGEELRRSSDQARRKPRASASRRARTPSSNRASLELYDPTSRSRSLDEVRSAEHLDRLQRVVARAANEVQGERRRRPRRARRRRA